MLRSLRRRVAVMVAAVAVAAATLAGVGVPTAAAEDCELVAVEHEDGTIEWIEVCEDGGGEEGGGGGGGGGGGEPTCDTSVFDRIDAGGVRFCQGEIACWGNFPSTLPEDMWEELAGSPRPGPDYIVTYVVCMIDGERESSWQWVIPPEDTGPSLWDLAWIAHGNLATPQFQVAFNPPGRSIVSIETWFWADGATAGNLVGESGGAVTAIAEPDVLQIDPGDGSGVRDCPFTVDEGDACWHAYRRASVGREDGYPAQMRLRYTVRFENNGAPLELDGLPTTLDSPWVSGAVPVAEVQAIVD